VTFDSKLLKGLQKNFLPAKIEEIISDVRAKNKMGANHNNINNNLSSDKEKSSLLRSKFDVTDVKSIGNDDFIKDIAIKAANKANHTSISSSSSSNMLRGSKSSSYGSAVTMQQSLNMTLHAEDIPLHIKLHGAKMFETPAAKSAKSSDSTDDFEAANNTFIE
jgi:hypothetical protein